MVSFAILKPISDSIEGITDDNIVFGTSRTLIESVNAIDKNSIKSIKTFSDSTETIDEWFKTIKQNKEDICSTYDGLSSISKPKTLSYDTDDDPYFVRVYSGTLNQSYSQLGIVYKLTIK